MVCAQYLEDFDMSNQMRSADVASQPVPPVERQATHRVALIADDRSATAASKLLQHLFRDFNGSIALRLWDGTVLRVGKSHADEWDPRFTLVFRDPRVVRSMVLGRDPLRLAEAYFSGSVDIEGDFFAALALKDQLQSIQIPVRDRLGALFSALRLPASSSAGADAAGRRVPRHGRSFKAHSKQGDRDAIQFHYDVSNDFYASWLDGAMVYSCAYFENPNDTLEQAQQAKLEHICRKLLLQPGERFLDIGCGWGALVMHAAQHYGVHAHGITLSRQQLDLARQRIWEAGLEDRVTVELRDYRDLEGDAVYDKIASVGMFEHVGLKNLPVYFSSAHRLLKPAGLFLNHGITHDVEGWKRTVSTEFINRYVFPDGQLDTVGNIQRAMEHAGLEILDVEALRRHYALTLRHWVARLERQHVRVMKVVSESTYRVWRLYMSACALEFESGEIGVYQILASKRCRSLAPSPLTRRHLYSAASPT